MHDLSPLLDKVYQTLGTSSVMEAYMTRHNIQAQPVLTVYDDETAAEIAAHLAPRIEGKVVVEVGGGIGLLACHLGLYAKRVYCIEANPVWAWSFVAALLEAKPKNVSYLLGSADEFVGRIKGHVALFCTHSGVDDLRRVGGRFADEVIDVYGEIIAANPDKFDPLARKLRPLA
jgi:predicted RNA methylase